MLISHYSAKQLMDVEIEVWALCKFTPEFQVESEDTEDRWKRNIRKLCRICIKDSRNKREDKLLFLTY